MLLNLCLEAKNIIENLPGMENSDTLRILARFLSEQASYDEQTKCGITVGFKVLAQNFKRFARYMLEQSKKVAPKARGTSMPILSQ